MKSRFNKTVAIYHLASTGETKYPSTADVTTTGQLVPMDRRDHSLEGLAYQNPHDLFLAPNIDIRIGDMVVIESETYYVKAVFSTSGGSIAHRRASLSMEV